MTTTFEVSCFSAVTEKASPSSNKQLVVCTLCVLVYVQVTKHSTTTSWAEDVCLSLQSISLVACPVPSYNTRTVRELAWLLSASCLFPKCLRWSTWCLCWNAPMNREGFVCHARVSRVETEPRLVYVLPCAPIRWENLASSQRAVQSDGF